MSKIIFLIDIDAFFCSVEMLYNPCLANIPFAVAYDNSHHVISSANYLARKYGVKSGMSTIVARRLCKNLRFVPPDHSLYQKISSQFFHFLTSKYTPICEQASIDECYLDVTNILPIFHNNYHILASQIQRHIFESLQLWVSIGISVDKTLAKIACEINKPKGIGTLFPDEIRNKLFHHPIDIIPGIGSKKKQVLHNYRIYTVGDFYFYPNKTLLQNLLGSFYNNVHELLNMTTPYDVICTSPSLPKSISKMHTFNQYLVEYESVQSELYIVANEVFDEIKSINLQPHQITLKIKYGYKILSSKCCALKYDSSLTSKIIFNYAINLFVDLWDGNPVKGVSIALSKFQLS